MKALFSVLMGLVLVAPAFASAEQMKEKDVVVNIHDVLVPAGFDADSDVYVIASGVFPNSCYKWKEAKVERNKAPFVHQVQATASVSQGMCLMVLVPFSREISLGRLGSGEHRVQFLNGDGTYLEKTIAIE